jgi:hypothetical protein
MNRRGSLVVVALVRWVLALVCGGIRRVRLVFLESVVSLVNVVSIFAERVLTVELLSNGSCWRCGTAKRVVRDEGLRVRDLAVLLAAALFDVAVVLWCAFVTSRLCDTHCSSSGVLARIVRAGVRAVGGVRTVGGVLAVGVVIPRDPVVRGHRVSVVHRGTRSVARVRVVGVIHVEGNERLAEATVGSQCTEAERSTRADRRKE